MILKLIIKNKHKIKSAIVNATFLKQIIYYLNITSFILKGNESRIRKFHKQQMVKSRKIIEKIEAKMKVGKKIR